MTAHRHFALLILSLIYVINNIDRQIIAILIEPIKREFQVSDTEMGLLSGLAFAALYALFSIPFGHLADRFNRTRIVAACCAFWSAMTVLCGMAGSFTQLLLARMGVAIGEAGGTAPSLSLIADLYPRERRSLAIAVFQCGPSLGLMIGLALGGWIAQQYGWRQALLVVGFPGLLLAAILAFAVREPRRGAFEPAAAPAAPPRSFGAGLADVVTVAAFRWLTAAACIGAMSGYAIGIWNPSFLVRTHGLSLQQAGLLVGLVGGVLATAGTLCGGWVTDRLVRRDPAWQLGVPILGILISVPFGLAFFLWPAGTAFSAGTLAIPTAFLFYMVFSFFATWLFPPLFAGTTKLFGSGQRGLASSVLLMALNLLGIGGGPLLAGMASDLLRTNSGQESLGVALAALTATQLLAAACLVAALKPYRRRMAAMSSK